MMARYLRMRDRIWDSRDLQPTRSPKIRIGLAHLVAPEASLASVMERFDNESNAVG